MEQELFRQNLVRLRRCKGLKARELCAQAGLKSRKRISDLEEGRGKASPDEIASIAAVLGVAPEDLTHRTVKVLFEFVE